MENFLTVATQVGILFALIGVGAFCRRAKLLDEASVKGMVNVLVLLVTPALIIDTFQRPFDPGMLRQFAFAAAIVVALHAFLLLLASVTFRGRNATVPVLRLSSVFSNAGFMGIPLEQAILGDEGVFYGIVYVATFNLFMWSWGLREMSGGAPKTWRELRPMLVNPGTIGLAVGLPLFLTSFRLAPVLHEPVHQLAALNTPLAMLVIGFYLAGAKLGPVLRSGGAHFASFLRLVACPLAVIAALYPFRASLDRSLVLAIVTASSAPVAAMTAMFASKFGRDVDAAVGLVSGTTLLSAATMPAVIALAMSLF